MKNRKMIRILTLILAASLVLTAVISAGAASYVGDINGDGKITAFDAQLLAEADAGNRELTATQKLTAGISKIADIMNYIFGDTSVDAGDLNGDGVYEIYSLAGLQYMAENPSYSYILEADLDLDGADWTPIRGFSGSFDGNGHTISNLTITKSVTSFYSSSDLHMGFFGDTTKESVITDLALRNVTLTAAEDAQFIGLVAGTSRGVITNCTVTGAIYDSRTQLPTGTNPRIYIGVLVGRTASGSGSEVTGGTSVSIKDDTGTHEVTGLCADAKLYIEDSENVKNFGLYGNKASDTTVTGIWRDSTNNASNESAVMQARQQQAVDYMNAMAAVAWQVPTTMTYNIGSDHAQTFEPGVTYYGLPYNGRNGGLERFMSCMEQINGINVATTRYGTDCMKTDSEGWYIYMGNDCSGAIAWAWMQISPNRVSSTSETECAGGAWVRVTTYMIPTDSNQSSHGIYPVGDWTTNTVLNASGVPIYDDIVGEFAYDAPDYTESATISTADFLTLNGETVMAEAYAAARKADALVGGSPSGHARLLTSYPVVIRTADGTIDLKQSFLVCSEQGDGLYDIAIGASTSSWRINYRWSFYNLLGYDNDSLLGTEDGNALSVGAKYSRHVYLPITIRALRSDLVKYAYVDEPKSDIVTGPASGTIYSNWRIVSTTVIVQDTDGKELFRNEAYTGLGSASVDYYRSSGQYAYLADAHGEAFNTFATENLEAGTTYRYSVQVHLANGETKIISSDSLNWKTYGHSGEAFDEFIYTPAEE